ncbi:pyruvate, phosphate dikinase [Gemelliphila palaticanis]|uniref:Pyruvate, phosphate dikinase n=1 Tax=Gemelliphila palaticanis TaxID=81950 RepID=A0ABX2SZY0_9BACL|nr:pyruvate, phosphate dikinase [Gemella palaticanis]MBF0715546.1 pyruvate, phosphate dikinase [Gemella palaticanis]NYS47476.1 pyruvate, phosphate dikinase [Gemella palaticanis]
MTKYVYNFKEGNKDMKSLLGGKGANLAEMSSLGISVPPGFTITTESCNDYYENNMRIKPEIIKQINEQLEILEKTMNKGLGSLEDPLLVSVRSGAVFSMPGMMDTILNLGLNDETTIVLAKKNNDYKFAYDSYRRFIQMFADVVMGVEKYKFETVLSRIKEQKNYSQDSDMTSEDLFEVVEEFKKIYRKEVGNDFPNNVKEQLMLAVEAVFKSWNNNRAKVYRRLNGISDKLGTAVNIQAMVFGNMGDNCGTGVCFSRNPSTGENKLFGEYLINAQGEDVVAGIRTPKPVSVLEEELPEVYKELLNITKVLENHYKDMQDIEFTIENEKLYILQTRNGKRTALSAVEIAVSLVEEGIITKEEALLRINSDDINKLLHPTFETKALKEAKQLTQGLAASPGASTGAIYFTAEEAVQASSTKDVILVREETSPEDIEGMVSSKAIVTSRGGMTSHAAVVARGMGKCCVCGAQSMFIDYATKTVRIGDITLKEGDIISVDGSSGKVYLGEVAKSDSSFTDSFKKIISWADEIRELKVFVNADNEKDAKVGFEFGAEGIGLCRTEHMFFEEDRISLVRKMILSSTEEERKVFLDKLQPIQSEDFYKIFKEAQGKSVNIRLLDPPLHEFLPHDEKTVNIIAKELEISVEQLENKIKSISEFNPMMGHRGCRLGVTYPEIYLMQAKAISQAAILATKDGYEVNVEVMIPLVGIEAELKYLKDRIEFLLEKDIQQYGVPFNYKIGTMIEIPRACLTADKIANHAEFFSFGTNDLTQMTFGYSRDDAEKFIDIYKKKNILEQDPFINLDESGVLELMKIAVNKAKQTRHNIKLGICGEHGGDEKSIESVGNIGIHYVSCSPYRVLIAKLAAAKTVIKRNINK